jgi:carbamoyl-phosphate synthase/aspartate carbamoyltransferase
MSAIAPTASSPARPRLTRAMTAVTGVPASPVTSPAVHEDGSEAIDGVLELHDGTAFRGFSFGAEGKSVAGECVFQTGISPSSLAAENF